MNVAADKRSVLFWSRDFQTSPLLDLRRIISVLFETVPFNVKFEVFFFLSGDLAVAVSLVTSFRLQQSGFHMADFREI